jgi:hypothetical protein
MSNPSPGTKISKPEFGWKLFVARKRYLRSEATLAIASYSQPFTPGSILNDNIVACASIQQIKTGPSQQNVVTSASKNCVGAITSNQHVIVSSAVGG